MPYSSREGIDNATLKLLSKVSAVNWLRDACLDWLIIICAIYIVYLFPNVLTVFLCVLILGNRQHALAILGHDGTHYRAHPKRRVNDLITDFFCFFPLGLTNDGYRVLHKKHHSAAGTDDDPEVVYKGLREHQWELPAKPLTILKHGLHDLVGFGIIDYKIILQYSKPRKSSMYLSLFLFHAAISAGLVYSGLWWVPVLWYLSLITSFMMFFRLRLWLEHQGVSDTHRVHLNKVEAALLAPHNSGFHWEHHNWPSVPYYNLPKVREIIQEPKVMDLKEILSFFRDSAPMPSGQTVKQ